MLTVGSLFAGIGGLELGLERAGMRVAWQVEKDEYCRRVLAKHWPEVERFEDVKDVGAHNLKPVDLICGGFPCQDISYAGKGAGLQAPRSGLWYEFARVIGEVGPRYAVVENVTALLTRGLDQVLGTLADLGYDAEWYRVSASDVGAPHRRQRILIVAHSNGERQSQPQGCISEGRGRVGNSREEVAHSEGDDFGNDGIPSPDRSGVERRRGRVGGRSVQARTLGSSPTPRPSFDCWAVEPDVGRVANGVPNRVDRLRALGNAVVPQVSEYIGRLIVEADKEMRGAA